MIVTVCFRVVDLAKPYKQKKVALGRDHLHSALSSALLCPVLSCSPSQPSSMRRASRVDAYSCYHTLTAVRCDRPSADFGVRPVHTLGAQVRYLSRKPTSPLRVSFRLIWRCPPVRLARRQSAFGKALQSPMLAQHRLSPGLQKRAVSVLFITQLPQFPALAAWPPSTPPTL
jgi:hypothetical protein